MSPRVLKRPKHGWARTRSERFLSIFDHAFWLCIFCLWIAAVGISMTASTITVIKDVIDYYDGDLDLEDGDV